MKLVTHKVTPFQAIKLILASELEVQKAKVSPHMEDSNREFFKCHAEKFDLSPTELLSCVYLEKLSVTVV